MAVKLNDCAYEHAKRLIGEGKFLDDEREAWSDHHPSTGQMGAQGVRPLACGR
jgi:hypothetical protein